MTRLYQIATRLGAPLLSLALSGCIGIAAVHPDTSELPEFSVSSYSKVPLQKGPNPSKEQVLATYGPPDSITREQQNEIWRYRDGFNWVGLVPMLVIPIPLVLPLVPSNTDIYFSGDSATKATFSRTKWSGFCFCPENESTMNYGFHWMK